MKDTIYKALGKFYHIEKDEDTQGTTHRLMILPAGMLAADAKIISGLLDQEINMDSKKEPIVYRTVDNIGNYTRERNAILDILMDYFDHLNAIDTDLVSILYIGVFIRPTIEILRAVKNIPQHIRVTDVYNTHVYNTIDQSIGQEEYPAGDRVVDCNVSYGDVPSKVLGKFMTEYIKEADRDVEYRFGIERLGRTTKVMYAEHVYAQLKDRYSADGINDMRWNNRNVETKDLYGGDPLCESLDPVLAHYMVYRYWHRIDHSDLMYRDYICHFIKGITDGLGDIDVEEIIIHEAQILRNTLWNVKDNIRIASNPYSCEIAGKNLMFSPPAIIEYEGSLHHPMPYEGVVADFLARKGSIVVSHREVHPIDLNWHNSTKALFFDCAVIDNNESMTVDEDYMKDRQKVELVVMHDPETGAMVVRSFNQKRPNAIRDALHDALTVNTNGEAIIIAPHSPADMMLSMRDFIYDPARMNKSKD